MGYPIIFKTRICRLSDGNIIHFTLQGCNNDDAGRHDSDWRGTYFTAQDWENWIRKWESTESNGNFDLKIGSRQTTFRGYGKHLRTMTKKASSFEDMCRFNYLQGTRVNAVEFYPEGQTTPVVYSPKNFKVDQLWYDVMYGRIKGRICYRRECITDEQTIVDALKNEDVISFYINPKQHIHAASIKSVAC